MPDVRLFYHPSPTNTFIGSVVDSKFLNMLTNRIISLAFSGVASGVEECSLQTTFIWKYERPADFPSPPANLVCVEWAPQVDLLREFQINVELLRIRIE